MSRAATLPSALCWVEDDLRELRWQDLERTLTEIEGPPEPEVTIEGRRYLLLASNNYLGLATDPRVKAAAIAAVERYGTGAGASRLVSGHLTIHRELEERLAALKGTEDAIVFGSGYLANVGTITALVGAGDAIYSDELNHASIVDGCRLSRAQVRVYRHRDGEHLAFLLGGDAARFRRRLIVTDAVFSMDGDLAPLPELVEVAERSGAMLMVDEAHATGVLGARGGGAVEHFGLQGRVPVIMGTLSKGLASVGGFVAGPRPLIDYLRNKARAFIFTTGLPPAAAGAAIAALEIVAAEPERRDRVLQHAQRLAQGLDVLGYRAMPTQSAVVPLWVGGARQALDLAASLRRRGVFCPAIRPPTVPEGHSRLRVVPMSTHSDTQIERALAAFAAAREELGRMAERLALFVTGTDTGVGKTVVTAAIAALAVAAGRRVAVYKPVQTGVGPDDPGDLAFIEMAAGPTPLLRAACSYRLRAPLAPAVATRLEAVRIDPTELVRAYGELTAGVEIALVEGAGGLLVPLTEGYLMADLARDLGLPLLVVTRPGLGTLNHTALTVEVAQTRGLKVAGLIISSFPEQPGLAERTNPPLLVELTRAPLLGVLPHLDGLSTEVLLASELAAVARSSLAAPLGGVFDAGRFFTALEGSIRQHIDGDEPVV